MVTTAAVRRLLLLRKVLALHEVLALRIRGSWELISAVTHSGSPSTGRDGASRCHSPRLSIVHLDPVSPESTRVEVIEYSACVIAGEKIGGGHAVLPGLIHDVPQLSATTRDRIIVLSLIREALK